MNVNSLSPNIPSQRLSIPESNDTPENVPVRILIVGVGSMFGDDQAGWLTVDRLNELLKNNGGVPPVSVTIKLATIPLDVLDWLSGVSCLHVIDACQSESAAGSIHRIEYQNLTDILDARRLSFGNHSTHDFSISDVLKLAQQTGKLPPQVCIWAIDGKHFELQRFLSPGIAEAIESVAQQIHSELCSQQ